VDEHEDGECSREERAAPAEFAQERDEADAIGVPEAIDEARVTKVTAAARAPGERRLAGVRGGLACLALLREYTVTSIRCRLGLPRR
jgi:hypothetical protein